MNPQAFRIGEAARLAGVNIQTLRFYERRGLIEDPPRRPSGYREYPAGSIPRVQFIKRAQELGFTLAEVQDLLRLRDDPKIPCRQVRATAQAKILDIDDRLRRLKSVRSALATLVASCAANRAHHCPLLEALDDQHRGAPVSRRRGRRL